MNVAAARPCPFRTMGAAPETGDALLVPPPLDNIGPATGACGATLMISCPEVTIIVPTCGSYTTEPNSVGPWSRDDGPTGVPLSAEMILVNGEARHSGRLGRGGGDCSR